MGVGVRGGLDVAVCIVKEDQIVKTMKIIRAVLVSAFSF